MVNWKIEDTANSEWAEIYMTHLGDRDLIHAGEKVDFMRISQN